MSREHRRAKTDRLDTEMLARAFLGRVRGEAQLQHGNDPEGRGGGRKTAEPGARKSGHRAHEDREPNQGDPHSLRQSQRALKAEQDLEALRTAEGMRLPDNTRAELRRQLARLGVLREQIRA